MSNVIQAIEQEQMKTELPQFNVGDTVKVHERIVEGKRERIQVFQGVILKRQNGGIRETFTARKFSYGVYVEKTWPVHSPKIEKIEVIRQGKVRQSKIFYLRGRVGKATRIKEKIQYNK